MKPNWSNEGLNRIKDAANRGRLTRKKNLKKIENEYYKNPKLCLECNTPLSYKNKNNKFCSRSCSGVYNNSKRKIQKLCLVCEKEINKGAAKYCSSKCQQTYLYNQKLEDWLNGTIETKSREFFRRYLTETQGYCCSSCGISEWNEKPIVLEIDHINGNPEHNRPENLRFICPNCHSQTDTYKGKNVGNGRHYRRTRYNEGKSY